MGIFGFLQWFFFNYKVRLGAILYLTKQKKGRRAYTTPRGMWEALITFEQFI
jgi:hypothetical protein